VFARKDSNKPLTGTFFDPYQITATYNSTKESFFFTDEFDSAIFSTFDVAQKTPVYSYLIDNLYGTIEFDKNSLNGLLKIHKDKHLSIKKRHPEFSKRHYTTGKRIKMSFLS
jgi:hypothetical protein